MKNKHLAARACLPKASRVVVKLGTKLLSAPGGHPERGRMAELVRSIAALHNQGREVVLVSSGAIGMGLEALGRKTRPKSLPELQMAAAVGQARLMSRYGELFLKYGITVSQVLLTHDDLTDRARHLNSRNAIHAMLGERVLPIVNENDVVAVEEITLGDNDTLAALVSLLINADLLLLLTSVNGLRRPRGPGRTERVPYLEHVTKRVLELAQGKGSEFSKGGMYSKLVAAERASKSGVFSVIADGRRKGVLERIVEGEDLGTLVGAVERSDRLRQSRKRWIAFFHRIGGTLVIDDGAKEALEKKGKSLLAIGIKEVRGSFSVGSLVNIDTLQGERVAKGIVSYGSEQIQKIKGRKTSEIAGVLGRKDYDEVIHRDNMAVLRGGPDGVL